MNTHVDPAHVMQIMDPTGHTTVTWKPDDKNSVADARKEFDRLRAAGYSAFKMDVETDTDGVVVEKKGVRVDRFDPTAGKLMMVPQLVGG